MHKMERDVVIDRSPAEVFAWMSDWTNQRAWMGDEVIKVAFVSEHTEADPVQEGVVFKETRKMGKTKATAKMTITEHGPDGDGFTSTTVCGDGCNRWVFRYDLRPAPDGACHASFVGWSEPEGFFGRAVDKVFGGMMLRMMEKCSGDHMDKLKAAIER